MISHRNEEGFASYWARPCHRAVASTPPRWDWRLKRHPTRRGYPMSRFASARTEARSPAGAALFSARAIVPICGATWLCRYIPSTTASATTTAIEADTLMSEWNITTNEGTVSRHRAAIPTTGLRWQCPNMANVMPTVLMRTRVESATCIQPGFTTILKRVKIANVISVIGAQILRASYMVRRNEALAIRAETAAVSEVGGDNSPHTESRKTKKCAIQGSMPSFFIGGTMTTAPIM